MKVGDVLQNETVVPEEPPVGATVRDKAEDRWTRREGGWVCPDGSSIDASTPRTWPDIMSAWGPMAVIELPVDLTPEPRYLALEDVRVGMRIRACQSWPDGTRTVEGKVTKANGPEIGIGGVPHYLGVRGATVTEIVLLEPAPTPEPEVGTVVRHAGATFARPWRQPGYVASARLARWLPVKGADQPSERTWWTWAQVLELDPAHAPEIVEV